LVLQLLITVLQCMLIHFRCELVEPARRRLMPFDRQPFHFDRADDGRVRFGVAAVSRHPYSGPRRPRCTHRRCAYWYVTTSGCGCSAMTCSGVISLPGNSRSGLIRRATSECAELPAAGRAVVGDHPVRGQDVPPPAW
jgi:hypothetical protein